MLLWFYKMVIYYLFLNSNAYSLIFSLLQISDTIVLWNILKEHYWHIGNMLIGYVKFRKGQLIKSLKKAKVKQHEEVIPMVS